MRWRRDRGHRSNGKGRENTNASRSSAGQDHLAIDGQVGRGAEQAGVAGNAVHPTRGWVVDRAPQHDRIRPFAGPTQRRACLGRRDPWYQRLWRQEARVHHPQRLEDVLPGVVL